MHPLGVFANDGDVFVTEFANHKVSDVVDQAARLVGGVERSDAENVFVVVVVLFDFGGHCGRRCTDSKVNRFGRRDVWQLRQRHAAGVAANQQVNFFIRREFFDRTDTCLWVLGFVSSNIFKLASEHATFFVDVVHRHLDGCERVTAHLQLHRGGHANADRLGVGGLCQCLGASQHA